MKRILTITLFLVMLLSVFSACQTTTSMTSTTSATSTTSITSTTKGTTSTSSTTSETREEIDLTGVFMVVYNRTPDRPNVWDKMLHDKFGINVEWEEVSDSDAAEKLNLMFSANQHPDFIFNVHYPTINNLAMSGKILPVSDYFDKLPDLISSWDPAKWQVMLDLGRMPDGKLYFLPPQSMSTVSYVWMFRVSELEILGFEKIPSTADELYDYMKAVKEKYPDSLPMSCGWGLNSFLRGFSFIFHTNMPGRSYVDPDTNEFIYDPVYFSENFRDMMIYVNKLYEEDLVDKELATNTFNQFEEKTALGLTYVDFQHAGRLAWLNNLTQQVDPSSEWDWARDYPTAYPDKGRWYCTDDSPFGHLSFAMTDKLEGEELDRVIEWINWEGTEEGQLFCSYGLEGDTFDFTADGKPKLKDFLLQPTDSGVPPLFKYGLGYGMHVSLLPYAYTDWQGGALISEMGNEFVGKSGYKTWTSIPIWLTDEEKSNIADPVTIIKDLRDEYLLKFLMGQLDPANDNDWNAFLSQLKAAGIEDIAALNEQGYDRAKGQ